MHFIGRALGCSLEIMMVTSVRAVARTWRRCVHRYGAAFDCIQRLAYFLDDFHPPLCTRARRRPVDVPVPKRARHKISRLSALMQLP